MSAIRDESHKKELILRLKRVEGQLRGIQAMIEEGRDLHELLALMAPRPFFVAGGSEDKLERWKALNHLVAVSRLLGFEGRVGLATRPDHTLDARTNEEICVFFGHFLRKTSRPEK